MSFDGNGNYSLPTTSVTPAASDTTIDSSDFNTFTADLETALSLCVVKDGQTANPRLNDPQINEAVNMTSTSTELNLLDGATVTTDEINILDGVTSTAAELNQLDGVTVGGSAVGDIATIDETITSGTLVDTSLGGTEAAFTSIPSWVKKITISLSEVSAGASGRFTVEIGDSGGYENTLYRGGVSILVDATAVVVVGSSAGFDFTRSVSSDAKIHGTMTLTLVDSASFYWASTVTAFNSNTGEVFNGASTRALDSVLDRLRVYANGNTFDSGLVNILYEG